MKRSWIFLSSMVLLMASCKMGKNYKGTDVVVPNSFGEPGQPYTGITDTVNTDSLSYLTSEALQWWGMFNDPVLDSLVRVAERNNKNLLVTAENILQARYQLNIQNAEFLPKFNLQGSAQRGNFIFNQVRTETDFINIGAGLNWELDFWGKYRRLSEAARNELLGSEFGYRNLRISLYSQVAETYFSLLEAKALLEIGEKNKALRDSMLGIIKERYDKGIIPMIDVNQAEIQYAIAASSVPFYKRRLVQIQNTLNVLCGRLPQPIETKSELKGMNYEIDLPVGEPYRLLARRPDLLELEARLIAQNARIGAAQANRLPAISVSGLLGVGAQNVEQLSFADPLWYIAGSISGPIFYWGQLKRQVDIERSRSYQRLFQYEQGVLIAFQEIENLRIQVVTLKEQIEIGENRVRSALNAQMLSRERYAKGVTSYLEFLESQRQAFDAEIELAGYRRELLATYAQLYRALGGGWQNDQQP